MSTSLFARLSRRFGPNPGTNGPSRREMLATTLAASAGLMLSRSGAFGRILQPSSNAKRVVVVGAGFSGLACAFELIGAGYDVTVIEARERLGGRVLSFGDFVPNKNVEGGGELIGSNHPTWVAYAERFGLEFLDVTEDEHAALPVSIGGKLLSPEEAGKLWEEMEAAVHKMNTDAELINADQPWLSPNAVALDNRTTQEWLDSLELEPLCKTAVTLELAGNNGQICAKQSYLGNLTQIKGGGIEKYWTDSEIYRCKGGNQQLAFKLGEAIGAKRIILGLSVRSIRSKGRDGAVVECADGRTIECDDVVLTVPAPTWPKIQFRPPLPPDLAPQMGVNVKYLSHLKSRIWKDKNLSPDALTDGQISLTWDGTDNQYPQGNEGAACLNAFSGGPAAERARSLPKAEMVNAYANELEKLYPGYKDNLVATRFMDWPSEPWTQGGYSFPAPGEITRVGPAIERGLPNLHFAGEHTCYKFVGYMEGALNSGATAARKLAQRDGLWKAPPVAPATLPSK